MEEWLTLLKRGGIVTLGSPARCARHDITLPGHIKTNVKNPWKYVQTVISDPRFRPDWCQDTSDSLRLRRKGVSQFDVMELQDSRE